jgi:hypothetical protein
VVTVAPQQREQFAKGSPNQSGKQASKQAPKQAPKQASQPASRQTAEQAAEAQRRQAAARQAISNQQRANAGRDYAGSSEAHRLVEDSAAAEVTARQGGRKGFTERRRLRNAIVLSEVLGPPRSMQDM